MSLIGKKIEEFNAKAYLNEEFIDVSEKDLTGTWSVLFFYPADFTFVCPTELEDLANIYDEFKAIDTEIYSVSTDSHFTHKAWHDHSEKISKIKYPMIADPTHKLTRSLESLIEEDGMAERSTFILNPDAK